jgi:Big-like domain-containing protein
MSVNPSQRSRLLMALLVTAAGCGGSDGPATPNCSVTGVSVTAPAAQIQVGKTTTMSASVTQANCTPAVQATWESSQPSVASVDASGVVTGVAAGGPVTITARAQGQSGTAQITVIAVPVATVALTPATATAALGETTPLTAAVRDADGNALTGRTVAWTSSDPTIATVSSAGVVSPVVPGTVTITATSEGKSATAAITVIAARAANRFAYAWANDPTSTLTYTPSGPYAFNLTGGDISVTRTATGRYSVQFGRLAKSLTSDRETAMVSAYGSVTTRCVVIQWGNTADGGLLVTVGCADPTGAAVDARFSILVVGSEALPGRSGFAWAPQTGTAQYTPPASYAYSSSGQAPAVSRQAVGDYLADLKLARAAGDLPENYFVTAYGDPSKMCKIANWGSQARVLCFTNAGAAADAMYDVLLVERGRTGKRLGFAWADQPSAATYTPNAGWARNSTGGAITVNRVSTGLYDVTFAGLAKPGTTPENVQVTSYAGGYSYCSIVNWLNSGTSDLTVRVACTNAAGAAVDSYYQVLVIE